MVEIKINNQFAKIMDGEWSSGDEILLRIIRAQMPFFEREFKDYAPDADYAKAAYIAEKFGGKITTVKREKSDAPEKVVF